MNRGRHKKSNKEKELYTQNEILCNIEKELYILLKLYRSNGFCNTKSIYALASISSDKLLEIRIVAWYINDIYYLKDFISKVRRMLNLATVENSIYSIRFEFGDNFKIFKYKA
jgi:hypothetical protein